MIYLFQYFRNVNKNSSCVYTNMIWVDSCIICSVNIKKGVVSAQNSGKMDISTIDHYRLLSVENLLSLSLSLSVKKSVSVIPEVNVGKNEQD